MSIKYIKILSFQKLNLLRKETPLCLTKKLKNMRFKLSKHYKRFMSDETDIVKQKELEDYYKYQIMLKNRQQNFIKLLKIIFIKKPILKRQSTPKNEIKDFNINLYFRR